MKNLRHLRNLRLIAVAGKVLVNWHEPCHRLQHLVTFFVHRTGYGIKIYAKGINPSFELKEQINV